MKTLLKQDLNKHDPDFGSLSFSIFTDAVDSLPHFDIDTYPYLFRGRINDVLVRSVHRRVKVQIVYTLLFLCDAEI